MLTIPEPPHGGPVHLQPPKTISVLHRPYKPSMKNSENLDVQHEKDTAAFERRANSEMGFGRGRVRQRRRVYSVCGGCLQRMQRPLSSAADVLALRVCAHAYQRTVAPLSRVCMAGYRRLAHNGYHHNAVSVGRDVALGPPHVTRAQARPCNATRIAPHAKDDRVPPFVCASTAARQHPDHF